MPTPLTYPGVYIEEVPSGVRTIAGVATSITAFVGRALRGKVLEPVRIQSFADYERAFGGLWEESTMSYAVQQYFLNDGVDALIVRVENGATTATIELDTDQPGTFLTLAAASAGAWGAQLRASVDHATKDPNDAALFNLVIEEISTSTGEVRLVETFRNVSTATSSARFVTNLLQLESQLVRVNGAVGGRPKVVDDKAPKNPQAVSGGAVTNNNLVAGINALDQADLFNLLCVPPIDRTTDVDSSVRTAAAAYCAKRRALFIADPPATWSSVGAAATGVNDFNNFMNRSKNAAAYFPRVRLSDPLRENRLEEFPPCGIIAGIYARTDNTRGVWKAPAGTDAVMRGVRELAVKMTDLENGQLNPLGLNALRAFPVHGPVVWGARTLDGADVQASEWKYVPVPR